MNEQAVQNLKHLLTNPSTWLFFLFAFVFSFALTYALKYIRQFLPKKLQEKMAKEKACSLEFNQKPQMQQIHKNVRIGLAVSIVSAMILSYSLNKSFSTIVAVTAIPVMLYAIIAESKISKDKECSDIYDKRDFLTMVGIYGGIIALLVFVLFYFEVGRVR